MAADRGQWPLHAKKVKPLQLEKMIEDEQEMQEHMQLVWRILNDATLYQEATKYHECCPSSNFAIKDAETLCEAQSLRDVQAKDAKGCSIAFDTEEEVRRRRRPIIDTLADNVLGMFAPKVTFSTLLAVKALSRWRYALAFDFAAYYHQFPLADQVGECLSFRIGDRHFAPTRAPMGHKNMVYVAQATTIMLARRAVKIAEAQTSVEYDIIIDNVVFVGDDRESLARVEAAFNELCAKYDVTYSEQSTITETFEYRGLAFDLAKHTVCLKKKWIDVKWKPRVAHVIKTRKVTPEQLDSLAGMAAWAIGALDIKADVFFFWKFVAHAAHARRKDKSMLVWPVALQALRIIDDIVKNNEPVQPVMGKRDVSKWRVFVSDAALEGGKASWGAVVMDPTTGQVAWTSEVIMQPPHEILSINYWEMYAVRHGLLRLKKYIPFGTTVATFVDNQVAIAVLEKTRTPAYHLYQEMHMTRQLVHDNAWEMLLAWVPSAENPTDGLSREKGFNMYDRGLLEKLSQRSMAWVVTTQPAMRGALLEAPELTPLGSG